MRIALRHIGAGMTQQLLYLVQAHTVLDQKADVGMAKIMDIRTSLIPTAARAREKDT